MTAGCESRPVQVAISDQDLANRTRAPIIAQRPRQSWLIEPSSRRGLGARPMSGHGSPSRCSTEYEEMDEDDLTVGLMMALERLSPLERAAFLLHDVFGVALDEVAAS